MRWVRNGLTALLLSAALTIAGGAAATAQTGVTLIDGRKVGAWDLGYGRLDNGTTLCTVVSDTVAEGLSFSFVEGDIALYVSFRVENPAGLSGGGEAQVFIGFEIGAESVVSDVPVPGAIIQAPDGVQVVFLIGRQAADYFKRANTVVFTFAPYASPRYSLRGSRRALDALEACARDNL